LSGTRTPGRANDPQSRRGAGTGLGRPSSHRRVSADQDAKDVEGWDSFKQIEILLATEERFGVKFSTREVDSLQNVGDLARLVAAKTGKA
jgi:acyl carrier protein